jgi:hypothetical protein
MREAVGTCKSAAAEQPGHRVASVFCHHMQQRGQAAERAECGERVEDIEGAHHAAPIPANDAVDVRRHGIRATLAASSLVGCPTPPNDL